MKNKKHPLSHWDKSGYDILQEGFDHLDKGTPIPKDSADAIMTLFVRLMYANSKKEAGEVVVGTLGLKLSRGARMKKDHDEVVVHVLLCEKSGMELQDAYVLLQEKKYRHYEAESLRRRFEKHRSPEAEQLAQLLHERNGPFVVEGTPRFDNYPGIETIRLWCAVERGLLVTL